MSNSEAGGKLPGLRVQSLENAINVSRLNWLEHV